MTRQTRSAELRQAWRRGSEIALIDVRDEGPYSEAHPFFAISVPLAEIEQSVPDLVPRHGVPIVVYDDGEGLAEKAARRLAAIGYSDVSVLAGGLSAYSREGEVFRDVNVPSKAFGELVEAIRHTPSLPADEIRALIEAGTDMVVLDARRFEEYRNMSIPTGISVPGAELALRVRDLAPSAGCSRSKAAPPPGRRPDGRSPPSLPALSRRRPMSINGRMKAPTMPAGGLYRLGAAAGRATG